jgi:hypothetical protein
LNAVEKLSRRDTPIGPRVMMMRLLDAQRGRELTIEPITEPDDLERVV